MKRVLVLSAVSIGLVAVLPVIYLVCALGLSMVPVNRDFKQPVEGIEILVLSNGVHAEVAVPAKNEIYDWTGEFQPDNFTGAISEKMFIAIGWGDRRFYLTTPTWSDLTVSTALQALFVNSPTVLHTTYIPYPNQLSGVYRLKLTPEQYGQLIRYILTSLKTSENGRPIWIPGAAYGARDAFYEAQGNYTMIKTCNHWTGRALETAGIKIGVWTPFAFNVTFYLPQEPGE